MYQFPLKVFPNHLNDFARCPRKFRCGCDPEVKVPFEANQETFIGKAMHAALRAFFDLRKLPMHDRRPDRIRDLLRNAWSRLPKGFGSAYWTPAERRQLFGSTEQERACGQHAFAVLENFLSRADLSVVPLILEEWLTCTTDGVTLGGCIDRIDQDGESAISVWDYKTGKPPFHKTAQDLIESGDYQLPLYGIIAGQRFPFAQKVRVGLIYVATSEVQQLTWTREELDRVKEAVAAFILRMKSEDKFAPRINPLCDWCAYQDTCPAQEASPDHKEVVEELCW
jgi:putative RecB family exonuclease